MLYDMNLINLSGQLLTAGTFIVIVGCSASHEDDRTRTFIECMEQIQGDQLSSQECRRKASDICFALSRELAFSTRIRLVLAETKGIASDLSRLAGIEFESWNYSDCVAVQQDICQDLAMPCEYESCLMEISQKCSKYGDH